MKLIRSVVNILVLFFFVSSVLCIFAHPSFSKKHRRVLQRKQCVNQMKVLASKAEAIGSLDSVDQWGSASWTAFVAAQVASAGVALVCQPASSTYSLIHPNNPEAVFDVYCHIHGHLSRADGDDKEKGISNLPLMDRLERNHIDVIICFFLGLIFMAVRAALPAQNDS